MKTGFLRECSALFSEFQRPIWQFEVEKNLITLSLQPPYPTYPYTDTKYQLREVIQTICIFRQFADSLHTIAIPKTQTTRYSRKLSGGGFGEY